MKGSAILVSLVIIMLQVVPPLFAQERGLDVVARQVAGSPNFEVGTQYAVIIGIDRYQEWMPLKNAVAEAKELKRILSEDYYIDQFIELYDEDATVANIRRLFGDKLPSLLGVHDSLLVFYAGHGHLDSSKSGYWIPVDGGTDIYAQNAWLPNAQLRNYLAQLKAQRILVLADSCFSGDLLNTMRGATPTVDSAYYKKALTLTSRQVLSSGASETVPDESEFARQLLGFLERNTEPLVDAFTIYDRLRLGVSATLPLYGTLPGNEQGASFVLFHKGDSAQQPKAVAAPSPEPAPVPSKSISMKYIGGPSQEILKALVDTRGSLAADLASKKGRLRAMRSWGWVSFGIGILGSALGAYGYFDGVNSYGAYHAAASASSAADARTRAELDATLMYIGVGSGGAGLITSPFLLLPDPAKATEAALIEIDRQIAEQKK